MKLNYKRTFLVGLAFLSISAFWQLYDGIIPLILKNTFAIGDTLAGGVMALDNILALFMLPLFGTLSDRVSTPIGRRMPFILLGTALTVIFMLLIPISDNAANFPMFMTSLIITLVSVSLYRSPAVALMPDVTPRALRSKANAIINLMGAVGTVFTLVMITLLVPDTDKPNYLPLFGIVAGIMVTAVGILFFTINEKKLAAEVQAVDEEPKYMDEQSENQEQGMPRPVRRSLLLVLLSVFLWFIAYNGATTHFSKYAQTVLGMSGGKYATILLVATVVAVISYIPVGIFAARLGRKKTILLGISLMFIAFAIGSCFSSYHPLLSVLFGLVGMGWAAINVNSYPMVVEMAKGSDIGRFTGYYYTFSMSGQVITPIISGALLEHVSYRTLFPYSAVLMLLAFCAMSMVKHGDHRPELPKDKLEMLDIGD